MDLRRCWLLSITLAGCTGHGGTELVERCPSPCPPVTAEVLATFRAPADSVRLEPGAAIAATSGYVAVGALRGLVALYGLDGAPQGVIGGYGSGPGAFRTPQPVQGPGDSVWVLDGWSQRVSVLGSGGAIVRTFPLYGSVAGILPLAGGRVLVEGALQRDTVRDRAAHARRPHALYVVTSDGEIADELPGLEAGTSLTVGRDGESLWAAPLNRARLTERTLHGDEGRTLELQLDWFEPWDDADVNALRIRPHTTGITVDSAGLVWVRALLPTGDRYGTGGRLSISDAERVFTTMIEVVDPAAGAIVAEGRFEGPFVRPLGSTGLWVTAREDGEGDLVFDLWRPRITAPATN